LAVKVKRDLKILLLGLDWLYYGMFQEPF